MTGQWVRPLFVVAGLYDGILGLAFLIVPLQIFERYGVTPPNHLAYIQFPALLLVVFAVMFFRIATDPLGRRELMIYGCGLKGAYCATAFFYDITTGIPSMWIPWAWMDLAFLALFIAAWVQAGKAVPEHRPAR
jgi:hypothetical protein